MTDVLTRHFGKKHVVLPVIHVTTVTQACRNAGIALRAGADGVFIISHTGKNQALLEMRETIRRNVFPSFFLGINLLGYGPARAYELALHHEFDGIWIDDPEGLDLKESGLLYFGGTAFKTQGHVPDERLAETAIHASNIMDVVCTSGPETGRAAENHRLKLMADALVETRVPLAVASGVTPENVRGQMDAGVRAFLVATGVSRDFHEFDPARVEALVNEVRGAGVE